MNSRAQLFPQIKKTNQNHSTTIKKIEKEKRKNKNNASQKSCFYCTYLQIAIEGPARGYPLRTCFLQFLNRTFYKENSCFEPGDSFDFGKVCFVSVFKLI